MVEVRISDFITRCKIIKKINPDGATRYEIVSKMRHYEESAWHRQWKRRMKFHGGDELAVEKCIKNAETGKWKYADTYHRTTRTAIEFQHSYIDFDFEERNEFYSNLSIKTVWLYDLTSAQTRENKDGAIEILENNSNGFFRIAEKNENLCEHYVYIQIKEDLKIYRIQKLERYQSSRKAKSTIRYFYPTEEYTEDEFAEAIIFDELDEPKGGEYDEQGGNNSFDEGNQDVNDEKLYTLNELWSPLYSWIIVKNTEKIGNLDENRIFFINCDQDGNMFRSKEKHNCIMYRFADSGGGIREQTEYPLGHRYEDMKIWILQDYKKKRNK